AGFSSKVKELNVLILMKPRCSQSGFSTSKHTIKERDCRIYYHLYFCTLKMKRFCGIRGKIKSSPCVF
uniref:Uncharacterized protein n=1 Tax=Sus scrofa TaxID=9823 RepID=A0A8D1FJ74_PIG